MGNLFLPRAVVDKAAEYSLLIDYRTPRGRVMEAIEAAYPGIAPRARPRLDPGREEPRGAHREALGRVAGGRRAPRRGRLDAAVRDEGLHRVRHLRPDLPDRHLDRRRRAHAPVPVRRLRRLRRGDAGGEPGPDAGPRRLAGGVHLEVRPALRPRAAHHARSTPTPPTSPTGSPRGWGTRWTTRAGRLPRADPRRPATPASRSRSRSSPPTTSSPRSAGRCWPSPATCGTIPTPGAAGVEEIEPGVYRVAVRLATARGDKRIAFTLRLMEKPRRARLVFNPAAQPLPRRRGLPHPAGEDLRLGPHPQRAADAVLRGARVRGPAAACASTSTASRPR